MADDEYILKICSAGSYQVGKTSLIRRYAENTFSEDYLPTLGVDITTKRIIVDGKPIKLILMDTAGQEMFGNIRKSYFDGAAGCLIVYDITRRESFDSLDRWVADFRSNKGRETTPIVIIGNKNDLEADRKVEPEEGRKFAEEKGNVPFYECSAKLGGPEIPEIYVNLARQYLNSVQR
ncbi:MAG: Rab family GTPase [Candidatus Heimdallarchaeota archaeon]